MLLGYNEASKYIKMCLASTIEIIILMTNQGRSSRISTNLNLIIKRFGILYGPMHLIMYMHIYHIYIVLWMQCLNQKKKQKLKTNIVCLLNLIKRFGILYGPMHLCACTYIIFTLYLNAVSQPKKTKNKHCLLAWRWITFCLA